MWPMASPSSKLGLAAPPLEDFRLSWEAFFARDQLVNMTRIVSRRLIQIRESYDHGLGEDHQAQLVLVDGPKVVRLVYVRI